VPILPCQQLTQSLLVCQYWLCPRNCRLFWQSGGGYDRNVNEPQTLMSMIEYVHLNPVRRGLVARAVDWEWSSAAYLEDVGPSPLTLDPIPPEWLDTGT